MIAMIAARDNGANAVKVAEGGMSSRMRAGNTQGTQELTKARQMNIGRAAKARATERISGVAAAKTSK